jgi:NAD(P)-dependent dehydrogenase (short-subunit alcohol dehydrogenase family)
MAKTEENRTVVITGVTRGLGFELTQRFVERGMIVLGCGRRREQIAHLQKQYGSPHQFSVVDVSCDSEVKAWAEGLFSKFGPPDLLINNAGVINHLAPLWQVPKEEFDQVIDVNVKGTANIIRHFAPAMVKRGTGIIVNLSSGWGRSTSEEVAPYCASKYAIEGLTKALAEELPAGMAAIPLNPGIIDTDMLRICFQESAGHYPDAEHWSHGAADYILALSAKDNGLSRTIPQ